MQPTQQQIANALHQGASALNRGDARAAEKHLSGVLLHVPDEPNALFLLGGVKKKFGDLKEAQDLMLKALAKHPNPEQVHNSLANVFREDGQYSDAISHYEMAIDRNPDYIDALFNLGLLHHAEQRYESAAEVLEQANTKQPNSPQILNALGTAYKELSKAKEAELAFKQAIAVQPNYVKALNNLGGLFRTQHRQREAVGVLEKAIVAAPRVVEPRFILANIFYELGQFEKADEQYRTILSLQPDHAETHEALNRLYWEHGKSDLYGKSYSVGITASPYAVELCQKHLQALESVGRIEEALGHAQSYLKSFPSHAGLHQMAARLHAFDGNADEADAYYKSAVDLAPDNPAIRLDASKHMMQVGEFKLAINELAVAEEFEPDNQRLWAYKGLCWRMLGDDRHEWLNNHENYVVPATIETPSGYASTEDFLSALKADLQRYHTTRQAPVDQTLHGGSQTHGMLFDRPDATIQLLKQTLYEPIQDFVSNLPKADTEHPLLRRNTGAADFATSWSVWLRDGGFHVNHVHTMGWVSSSFYIDVPENDEDQDADHQGWIKFGESGLLLGGNDQPVKFIKPEPGMLVLFPSYMWHGTVAHRQDADRMTAPFDLLPA